MITEFVGRFMEKKAELQELFAAEHPKNYKAVIKAVVSILNNGNDNRSLDPERIHEIDDGNYQGTLIYVIGATGYQPNDYWYVKISYGSCTGCDTLEAIRRYSNEKPNKVQVRDYMTLALHVVQGLKKMGDDEVS